MGKPNAPKLLTAKAVYFFLVYHQLFLFNYLVPLNILLSLHNKAS